MSKQDPFDKLFVDLIFAGSSQLALSWFHFWKKTHLKKRFQNSNLRFLKPLQRKLKSNNLQARSPSASEFVLGRMPRQKASKSKEGRKKTSHSTFLTEDGFAATAKTTTSTEDLNAIDV